MDSDAEPLLPPVRPPPANRAALDAEYPLPPPVPNRPCARRDLGHGKKYATRADYDAALEAWRSLDQSTDRQVMRFNREHTARLRASYTTRIRANPRIRGSYTVRGSYDVHLKIRGSYWV